MHPNTKSLIQATITPLASNFGSGFLVIVPILAGAVGEYSVLVMAIICGLAKLALTLAFIVIFAVPAG